MIVPLHVFEPRYRQLVQDCVENDRLLAVSHTLKTIHEPSRAQQSTEEALRSNQATYKPQQVFSAGRCEILETTPDGRLLATVTMTHRLTLIDDIQSLPYRIVLCAVLKDRDEASWNEETRALQRMIHERLDELVASQNEDLAAELRRSDWLELDPETYSYSIFQVLRFPADIMQHLLEIDSVTERLEALAGLLGAS
jgi:Lon protease-like protein